MRYWCINKFKKLNKPYNPQEQKDSIDYNHLVDDMLQISPPYNYCNPKDLKHVKAEAEVSQNGRQMFDSAFISSQKSVVQTKPKINTIAFDASPQQINWNPTPVDDGADKIDAPVTRLMKKKSSTLSMKDIKNTTQKKIENEDLLNRSSQNYLQIDVSKLGNLYNLDNYPDNVNDDAGSEGLLIPSNPKITRSIPRRVNVPFNKSLSGFSNFSNSNDMNNPKSGLMQDSNVNLFKTLQGSISNMGKRSFNSHEF